MVPKGWDGMNENGVGGFSRKELIGAALAVHGRAYAPYSHFPVAAAVLASSGKVYTGVNVENASYGGTICAERTAVLHAVTAGERRLTAIAVVGGADPSRGDYCMPCGICRQFLREFCDPEQMTVVVARTQEDFREYRLSQLLPDSFGPDFLTEKG